MKFNILNFTLKLRIVSVKTRSYPETNSFRKERFSVFDLTKLRKISQNMSILEWNSLERDELINRIELVHNILKKHLVIYLIDKFDNYLKLYVCELTNEMYRKLKMGYCEDCNIALKDALFTLLVCITF